MIRSFLGAVPFLGTVMFHAPGPLQSIAAAVMSAVVVYLKVRAAYRVHR